jgi:magnesium-transporting ATPase (P-type)
MQSQTATAILLSITGLWVLSSLDRPTNKIKLGILLVMLVLAFALFYLPITTEFFGFTQLSLDMWIPVLVIGLVAGVATETISFMVRRQPRTR